MASQDEQDPRISEISSVIRLIPNFPKPGKRNYPSLFFAFCFFFFPLLILLSCSSFWSGIMFQDITTLLLDTKAFRDTIDLFVERYRGKNISVVAGNFLSQYVVSICCENVKIT